MTALAPERWHARLDDGNRRRFTSNDLTEPLRVAGRRERARERVVRVEFVERTRRDVVAIVCGGLFDHGFCSLVEVRMHRRLPWVLLLRSEELDSVSFFSVPC